MKKKILILFGVIVALICSGLMLFNFGKNINSLIGSASASSPQAVTTEDSTQTVNFYGADNETIIYSVEVPTGSSLNDLASKNLLTNNYFDYVASSGNSNVYHQWYNNYSSLSYTENGITLTNNNSWQGLDYNFMFNEIQTSFTFSYSGRLLSGVSNFGIYTRFYDLNGNIINSGIGSASSLTSDFQEFYLNVNIPSGYSFARVSLWFNSTSISTVELRYSNLNFGNYDYFNIGYVDRLYGNSGGVIDNYFVWSQSSNYNTRFDFDTPLYSDLNLYGYSNGGNEIHNSYTGELEPRTSDFGAYALKDIVSFNVDGYFLMRASFTPRNNNSTFFNFKVSSPNSSNNLGFTTCNAFVFNSIFTNDYLDLNMVLCSVPTDDRTGNIGSNYFNVSVTGSGDDRYLTVGFDESCYGKDYYIYFSNYAFDINSVSLTDQNWVIETDNYLYNRSTKYIFTENLESIVDMNSNTNYEFSLLYNNNSIFSGHDNNNYLSYWVLNKLGVEGYLYNDYSPLVSIGDIVNIELILMGYSEADPVYFTNNSVGNELQVDSLFAIDINSTYMPYSSDKINVNYYYTNFYFVVDKPVYRVNNALLIYNFDYYNTLVNINNIHYELYRDGVYYDVVYNGLIPNYKYIYISNDAINNTIFDRYIFLHFDFIGGYIPITVNEFVSPYQLGFDFNFSYFLDPLISDTGIYDYTFEKPGFVDMPISLSPLYIPFMEALENAIIFLVFYCPVLSQVLSSLHFDQFFGALMNSFDFIFNSNIGQFVLACLIFIILWGILKSLFPVVSSGVSNVVSRVNDAYGDYRHNRYLRKSSKKIAKYTSKKHLTTFKDNYERNKFPFIKRGSNIHLHSDYNLRPSSSQARVNRRRKK